MSKQKTLLLGENFSTANAKLRKSILFDLIKRLQLDTCYRCKLRIDNIKDLSIEHKQSWQRSNDPKKAFYDLDNIAFSHLECNSAAAIRYVPSQAPCGTRSAYKRGCRCKECTDANRKYIAVWRNDKK